jgi:hypothetical protein
MNFRGDGKNYWKVLAKTQVKIFIFLNSAKKSDGFYSKFCANI